MRNLEGRTMKALQWSGAAGLALIAALSVSPAQAQCAAQVQTGFSTNAVALAQRCGTTVGDLRRANPGRNLSRPGLVRIPGGSTDVTPPSLNNEVAPRQLMNATRQKPIIKSEMENAPAARGDGALYTIRRGDTLGAIAAASGVNLNALMAANPGVRPRALAVGQQIRIPAS